ncbi:MAG: hypothetical protein CME65_06925 [Halobacteriovoraceae bacterium]|nr:hypothetical protein [Halobacteriovoraceae bacterium]|tara:strand:- start:723 stop:1556 length:834 start_codon:yes stop_codon:yes gene_type:complete
MKHFLFLLLSIFPFIASAQESKSALEPIFLQSSRDSYILGGLLDHLKTNQKDILVQKEIIEILNSINKNLSQVPQENYLLLIDTEMTKAILNYRSNETVSDLSGAQIILAKKRLENNRDEFGPFIKSIFSRMLLDYEPFIQSKVIFNLKNPKYRDVISEKDKRKINLLNKYLGEKLYFFADAPKSFVQGYVSRLCLYALKNLELASYAYKFNRPGQSISSPIFTGLDSAKILIDQLNSKSSSTPQVTPQAVVEKLKIDQDPSPKLDELIDDVSPNNN